MVQTKLVSVSFQVHLAFNLVGDSVLDGGERSWSRVKAERYTWEVNLMFLVDTPLPTTIGKLFLASFHCSMPLLSSTAVVLVGSSARHESTTMAMKRYGWAIPVIMLYGVGCGMLCGVLCGMLAHDEIHLGILHRRVFQLTR